jgi:hypothetical protein
VRSGSFHKQIVQRLAGFSGRRELLACFFLPLIEVRLQYTLHKQWGSVAELTCHLQGSIPYGIRSSYKIYRPSLTKDVTKKDPPLIRGPLTGG